MSCMPCYVFVQLFTVLVPNTGTQPTAMLARERTVLKIRNEQRLRTPGGPTYEVMCSLCCSAALPPIMTSAKPSDLVFGISESVAATGTNALSASLFSEVSPPARKPGGRVEVF